MAIASGQGPLAVHRPFATGSGALLVLAPGPALTMGEPHFAAGAGMTCCLLAAGLTIVRWPRLGRLLATAGILGTAFLAATPWLQSPAPFLTAALIVLIALAALWGVFGYSRSRRTVPAAQAYGASVSAVILWFGAALLRWEPGYLSAATAFVIAGVLGLRWAWLDRRAFPGRTRLLFFGAVSFLIVASASLPDASRAAGAGLLYGFSAVLLIPRTPAIGIGRTSWWEPLLGHPERLLAGTFTLLCAAGAVLLSLPASSTSAAGISGMDAVFTSVSAVCVTGLIVLDTPAAFSGFGQAVLLLLIQAGGLGIMTFSTIVLRSLGRRISLRHEGVAASLISGQDRRHLAITARRILLLTFAAESAGSLILSARFLANGEAPAAALWRGIFTSVSAFCNAGFALQSDSLIHYQSDPIVLHTVAGLIVCGGLSSAAVFALPGMLWRRPAQVSLQIRLGLSAAVVLLLGGFGFFAAFEWNSGLRHLPWPDRLHNAWFQSVTLRTAGFNSLDFASLQPATLSLSMIWMFIGGGPGGTAGGIKTTTAALLALSIVQAVRGSKSIAVFGKQVAERTRHRAAAVATLAFTTVLVALVALQLTQAMPGGEALFEVVSALGTVGLSIGGTARLDDIGKCVIIACMFMGRIGGLSLLMFMTQRKPLPESVRPEEEIDVG